MESLSKVVKDKYRINDLQLKKEYDKAIQDESFKILVQKLNLKEKELMKHTSKLIKSVKEESCCANCKDILECKNEVKGHIYYPSIENDNICFNYQACRFQVEMEEKNNYKKNIYTFDMPKEIKEASMKKIYIDDEARLETVKWIKSFLDNYSKNKYQKGLYLTGNFGSGKTYLLSAMLNELAKKDSKVAIIYFPEFLRNLKSSFSDDDSYNNQFNYIKKVDVLLIDDIGAEVTTQWSRDEILGTILQYRMQEHLVTFFTSNLNIKELEQHLSITSQNIDQVKARRIIERIKYLTEQIIMIGENKRRQ